MFKGGYVALTMFLFVGSLTAQQASQNTSRWYPAVPTVAHDSDAQATKSILTLEPMPLVAPIFIEDGQTTSSIVIVNNSGIDAGATVSIRSLAGSEILHFHQALTPHREVELSLQALLSGVRLAFRRAQLQSRRTPV